MVGPPGWLSAIDLLLGERRRFRNFYSSLRGLLIEILNLGCGRARR
jgi:hypothetical protein